MSCRKTFFEIFFRSVKQRIYTGVSLLSYVLLSYCLWATYNFNELIIYKLVFNHVSKHYFTAHSSYSTVITTLRPLSFMVSISTKNKFTIFRFSFLYRTLKIYWMKTSLPTRSCIQYSGEWETKQTLKTYIELIPVADSKIVCLSDR